MVSGMIGLTVGIAHLRTRSGLFALMLAVCVIAGACAEPVEGSGSSSGSGGTTEESAPHAGPTAGTTELPKCSSYVDATGAGEGTAASPFKTIGAAVEAAENDEIICVAEGTYSGEKLAPGAKFFTLAGGFQTGKDFMVRDSAKYVSMVKGGGDGSFYKADDPAPKDDQLVAIDGFDISGYAQAISRATYFMGRFDITNNTIHDNDCNDQALIGAAFSLANVKATIKGNVFTKNTCGRGGAGALDDGLDKNDVTFANNLVINNAGTEPESSHGGAIYLFGNRLTITANVFLDNEVTGWGAGLFVGANNGGGQHTTANLSWNVYRNNKAGINGGGLFCDDSATCLSEHDIYDGNCGGNVYVDAGPEGTDPTIGKFDHMTNLNAKEVGCDRPGAGFALDNGNEAADDYTITNSIFFGNKDASDLVASCGDGGCDTVEVNISYSMVQKEYANLGVDVTFGAGILAPADPLFVDAAKGDFHLQSTKGHWTPTGYVDDDVSSPALGKGNGNVDKNSAKVGSKPELGAYGNSGESSYTQ
jgi:hypothetical protein